jgi:hypothetical protein
MRATRVFTTSVPSITYGSDRVCAHPGCGTRLSAYNPTAFCGLHSTNDDELPAGFKQCKRCERVLPAEAFPLKRKTHNETVYYWRLGTCRQCTSQKKAEQRQRDLRTAKERSRKQRADAEAHRKANRDNYYKKRYGYATREAYWAACAKGEA